MMATCKVCGKIFHVKNPRQVYCSAECHRIGIKNVTINCKICGKAFKVSPKEASRRKTCSIQCLGKWRSLYHRPKTWKTMKCEVCGKEFHYYTNKRSMRRFCSNKCRGESLSRDAERRSKTLLGRMFKDHRVFRNRIRKNLQEFSDGKCEICGWNEAKIDICHIIPRKKGGPATLANVVFLCPNHHRMYDEGLIQREDLAALTQKRHLDRTDMTQLFQ